MMQQHARGTGIFGGNQPDFAQHAQRPQSNILQVADGGGYDEQGCQVSDVLRQSDSALILLNLARPAYVIGVDLRSIRANTLCLSLLMY